MVKDPSLEMVFGQGNHMPGQLQSGCHSSMELWPMYDGLLIVLKIKRNLDIIRHDGRQIDLVDLDDIRDKRSTDA